MSRVRRLSSLISPFLKGVFIIALVLQTGFIAPVAASNLDTANSLDSPSLNNAPIAQAQTTSTATENTSNTTASAVRHRDPDTQNKPGDLIDVRRWLGGNMRQVLVDCTDGIQGAEYAACDRLDEEYPDWMSKYVDIARETESEQDDDASAALNDTRENQQDFAQNVRQFRQTYDEYQQARQNGNEERAREIARELQRTSDQVNRTGGDLQQNYQVISGNSTMDLEQPRQTVANVTTNVTQQADEVTSESFVATTLTVDGNRTTISYRNPIRITGHLETENGSVIESRQIGLQIENRSVTVTTDETGDFSFVYRPTMIQRGEQELSISYRPASRSRYSISNASLPVTVEQTETSVTLSSNRSTVAFSDFTNISGRVTAAGDPVDSVPVIISLNGVQIARTTTTASGEFNTTATVPVSIPAGDQTLRATLPFSEQALAGSNASQTVSVESTPTSLSLSGSAVNDSRIRVRGALYTDTETQVLVPHQTVVIRVNGETVTSVQTNAVGEFTSVIAVPEAVRDNSSSVSITAQFSPVNSNLQADQTSIRISLPESEQAFGIGGLLDDGGTDVGLPNGASNPSEWLTSNLLPVLIGGLALVLIVSGGLIWSGVLPVGRNRTSETGSEGDAADEPETEASPDEDFATDFEPVEEPVSVSPLEAARNALTDGDTDTAVITAYSAIRRAFTSDRTDERRTHWEFYADRQTALDEDEAVTLRDLTEVYERAMFSPYSVRETDAQEAITAADTVLAVGDAEDAVTDTDPSRDPQFQQN